VVILIHNRALQNQNFSTWCSKDCSKSFQNALKLSFQIVPKS